MKITTYRRQTPLGPFDRLGILFNEGTIIDLNLLWRAEYEHLGIVYAKNKANSQVPPSLSELLKVTHEPLYFFKQSLEVFEKLSQEGILKTRDGADISFDLRDDKNTKMIGSVDQISSYRDFYTHKKHVQKGFDLRGEKIPDAWYEFPVYYKGSATSFIGPDDLIPWPAYSDKLDYGLELAAVIGKPGKNIKANEAFDHILGFTILNDISARDIQKKEMSVGLGPSKGKDFCSVLGPVITTVDEFNFSNPDLEMTAAVNGNEWSKGRSSEAHYGWDEMIAFASRSEMLRPTDILGSGTVGTGCGLEIDKWIQPGDKIELNIEKIGTLKNIVGTKGQFDDLD